MGCSDIAIACPNGSIAVDTNGDGCEDSCKRTECPPFAGECAEGFVPTDSNKDGCIDSCAAP